MLVCVRGCCVFCLLLRGIKGHSVPAALICLVDENTEPVPVNVPHVSGRVLHESVLCPRVLDGHFVDLWRRRVDSDAVGTHGLRGLECLVVGDDSAVVGPGARHGPTGVCHRCLCHLK